MGYYTLAFRRMTDFSGRSRRAEYWMFALINALIAIALSLLLVLAGRDSDGTSITAFGWVIYIVAIVYGIAVLLPAIALQWRRYQDIGWAGALSIVGWFIPLLTFIVALIPGNVGANAYGADPKS